MNSTYELHVLKNQRALYIDQVGGPQHDKFRPTGQVLQENCLDRAVFIGSIFKLGCICNLLLVIIINIIDTRY